MYDAVFHVFVNVGWCPACLFWYLIFDLKALHVNYRFSVVYLFIICMHVACVHCSAGEPVFFYKFCCIACWIIIILHESFPFVYLFIICACLMYPLYSCLNLLFGPLPLPQSFPPCPLVNLLYWWWLKITESWLHPLLFLWYFCMCYMLKNSL